MSDSRAARVRVHGGVVALCVVASFARTAAAREPVRFTYAREAGAEACPDEERVRQAIVSRLGFDAFVDAAPSTVETTIVREGRLLRADVRLMGVGGATEGARSLTAPAGQCQDLVEAVALAISLALAPETAPAAAPPDAPPAATVPTARALPAISAEDLALASKPSVDTPPQPPEHRSPRVSAGAGALVSSGTAPSPALGVSVFGEATIGPGSLGLELRFDPPASAQLAGGGTFHTSLAAATLAPCVRPRGIFVVCALVTTGVFTGASEGLPGAASHAAFFAAAGGRLGLEVPLRGPFYARAHGDLVANVTRHALDVDGAAAFTVSAVSGAGGVDLAVRF